MNWIAVTLKDPTSELYIGWNNQQKKYDNHRRVAIVMENYVVIIAISKGKPNQARFITAFLGDTPARSGRPSTVDMIRKSPRWKIKKPLICQAGSAVEAFKGSITSGEEQPYCNIYCLHCQIHILFTQILRT